MLSVRLDSSVERRLENLARQTGRTKTYYIAELVERHFAEMEARYLRASQQEKTRSKRK
jgi:RHH-type rel operon transcriptional repressor/antitoxin RelB